MLFFARTLFICFTLLLLSLSLNAKGSTSIDFESDCKYINSKGELLLSTVCKVTFGFIGAAPEGAIYILTFPNQNEVEIYEGRNGDVTVNGIPSRIAWGGESVVVVTQQGEIFIFKIPSGLGIERTE